MLENDNTGLPWEFDRASYAGSTLESKVSAARTLYGFLRSKGVDSWTAFWGSIEELCHALADTNPQGGDMCARFNLFDQFTNASYLPRGPRTNEEMVKIARASWPFMSKSDQKYERSALKSIISDKSKK